MILSLYLPVFRVMSWFTSNLQRWPMKFFLKYHYDLMDFNILDMFNQLQLFLLMLKLWEPSQVSSWVLLHVVVVSKKKLSSFFTVCMTIFPGSSYTSLAPDLKVAVSLSPRGHSLGRGSIYFSKVVHCFWAFSVNRTRKIEV